MRTVNRRWGAALSAAAVTVGLSVAVATPATAVGGPCGQGGNGSAGSAGLSGSLGSLSSGSLGSATGSMMNSLPWITGSPNGALPVLTGRTKALEMVTGPGSPNKSIERFSVSGTDLGIMWDNGKTGEDRAAMMLFGDTVGDCDLPGDQWRSNVLFRSSDTGLADGMRIDDSPLAPAPPNFSKQVIKGLISNGPGEPFNPEFTVIPTGGVAVDGVQYVRWMSVRSWDTPGEWTTNYSGLAISTDNGDNWTTDIATVRVNIPVPGLPAGVPALSSENANWQMSAFVPDRGDGYVYEFGTPSGRSGSARLARVPANPADMVDPSKYEYRTATGWSPNIADAVTVIGGAVSELSVQWNPYLNKYVAMYTDLQGLRIRQADNPWGGWSGAQTLIGSATLPSQYGGFMHPWSNTGNDKNLYFVLTTWDRYNVIYMRTDLSGMKMASTDVIDRPDPAITGEQKLEGFETPEGFVETVDGE
ncbi:DUF4185 domain-containing protein [Rhodococcus sp. ABRD24]|uniref:DUF4185 domain-containing protein n=1 Tax=Rhodococcus sp. ABRD24 TaxID=2507582 RepID=UPI00103BC3D8|nr:DUF4185 domain-containing protein [Rhodococcus sp. ABRD24]QBJ95089.1 DUF4185 domain-containing protein [Rhodococcus sp. ABRD24]